MKFTKIVQQKKKKPLPLNKVLKYCFASVRNRSAFVTLVITTKLHTQQNIGPQRNTLTHTHS